MTSTTETTIQQVHVRRLGYCPLVEIHPDHSVTVTLGDGSEPRIPFGDWTYAPEAWDKTAVSISYLLRNRLGLDLGNKNFAVTNSGIEGDASWFRARYATFTIEVKVTEDRCEVCGDHPKSVCDMECYQLHGCQD